CLFSSPERHNQGFGCDVFQVKAELLNCIRRVERRGRGRGRGDGEEGGDELDPVGEYYDYAVPASEAEDLQGGGERIDLQAQGAVRDHRSAFGHDQGGVGEITDSEETVECLWVLGGHTEPLKIFLSSLLNNSRKTR